MTEPLRAPDEDTPFSESMLEWLEEGDRMGQGPANGAARPSGAHHQLEQPKQRGYYLIGGGVLVAVGLVFALHTIGGKAKQEEPVPTVSAVSPREVPLAPFVPPAPVAAPGVPTNAVAPDTPAAPVAAAAPAAAPVVAAAPAAAAAPADLPSSAPSAAAPAAAIPAAPSAAAPAAVPSAAAPAAAPAAAAVAPSPTAAPVAAVGSTPVAPSTAPSVAVESGEPRQPLLPPTTPPPPAKVAAEPQAAVAAGDYDAAIADCRAQIAAGKIAHAVTSCKAATEAKPRSSEALTLLAEAEFTRGHTGVALKLATQATNANQNFADAYVIIGGVYQEKGRNAEARAAYEQYLALQPKGKHAADLRAILPSL